MLRTSLFSVDWYQVVNQVCTAWYQFTKQSKGQCCGIHLFSCSDRNSIFSDIQTCFKVYGLTFRKRNFAIFIGSTLKRNQICSRSKFIPVRVDPFGSVVIQENKQEVTKAVGKIFT